MKKFLNSCEIIKSRICDNTRKKSKRAIIKFFYDQDVPMQVFIVRSNGECHEIKDTDKPIKELIKSDQCYIITDDDDRIVYLWKGTESPVRHKFIGATASQKMRGNLGLNYTLYSVDEGEEPPELKKKLEGKRADGYAEEIIDKGDEVKFEVSDGKATYAEVMKRHEESQGNYENEGPLYQGGSTTSAAAPPPEEDTQVNVSEILDQLEKEKIPDGYHREMIIVGKQAWSVTEKIQSFLGQKKVEKVIDKIESLEDGIFLGEDYTPRLLCLNGKIKAIELLKKDK